LAIARLIKKNKKIIPENLAPNSGNLRADKFDGVTEICHRLALIAMVTKI